MDSALFREGDLVCVDPEHRVGKRDSEGGNAFVNSIDSITGVTVQYIVSKFHSPNVKPARLHPQTIATTGRRRSTDNSENIPPSLLAPGPRQAFTPSAIHQQRRLPFVSNSRVGGINKTTIDLLKDMRSCYTGASEENPVIRYLTGGGATQQQMCSVFWDLPSQFVRSPQVSHL